MSTFPINFIHDFIHPGKSFIEKILLLSWIIDFNLQPLNLHFNVGRSSCAYIKMVILINAQLDHSSFEAVIIWATAIHNLKWLKITKFV